MIEERVKKILASVMNLPVENITKKSSADNIEAWDSLKQMTLILTLEQEFNIQFTESQVYELLSCGTIVDAIAGMNAYREGH